MNAVRKNTARPSIPTGLLASATLLALSQRGTPTPSTRQSTLAPRQAHRSRHTKQERNPHQSRTPRTATRLQELWRSLQALVLTLVILTPHIHPAAIGLLSADPSHGRPQGALAPEGGHRGGVGRAQAQGAEHGTGWATQDPHEGLPDPRRAEAAPRQSFPERARYQTWAYDWLGNLTDSGDDADGFYDRSLGAAEHGPVSGRAYQLQRADNRATGSPRQGALRTSYDLTGNLTELRVDRDGPCIPAGHCAQVYRYAWDEVGRLVTARRWDAASLDVEDTAAPAGPAAVELHYGYDANDQRVSKRAVDPAGEQSFTLYVFDSLELRRTAYLPLEEDYALNPSTEVIYLLAGSARLARLAYEAPGSVPSSGGETVHVFLELGDHLGSTNTVLDLATSELVEKSTHYAYGGIESDYRPTRWNSFREDYKFTGKEEDIEVGLVYFGKRFYAPALQRWASPDPLTVHGLGADPNLYAYVSGGVCQWSCLPHS